MKRCLIFLIRETLSDQVFLTRGWWVQTAVVVATIFLLGVLFLLLFASGF